jgi:RNA polymerase sigma-B factor
VPGKLLVRREEILGNSQLRHEPVETLIARYVATGDPALRNAAIERHDGLVRSIAVKFARPGVPAEDLVQAGWIALIKALDRFDPSHGTKFSTYAVHCVVGEIKRYFRDNTWSLKLPRSLSDIAANLLLMQDRLYARLHREPTVQEMAEAFRISEEDLLHAMELQHAYWHASLHQTCEKEDGEESLALEEKVGQTAPEIEALIENAPLEEALAALDERDRRILRLRFWEDCTQTQVGDELHLSQMHVSRLERKALKRLRQMMAGPPECAVGGSGRARH